MERYGLEMRAALAVTLSLLVLATWSIGYQVWPYIDAWLYPEICDTLQCKIEETVRGIFN